MKRFVPVILLALGVTVASPALGQKKKAKAYFDAGVTALENKNYDKALQSFQNAYEVSPHWAVLAHIGTCFAKLDRPQDAIKAFQRYLDEGGVNIPPDEREAAERLIGQERAKLSVLVLTVDKEGVDAKVDGRSIGQSPFKEIVLLPGMHQVAVRFAADDVVEREIELMPGQEFILRIEQQTHVSSTPGPSVTEQTRDRSDADMGGEAGDEMPVFSPPPAKGIVKGSPAPFITMLVLTLADAVAVGVSWGFFIYNRASANNYQNTLDGLTTSPPFSDFTWEKTCSSTDLNTEQEVYFCTTELNRRDFLRRADSWMIAGIATSAALAVTGTLTIVFGLNRHWFGGSKGETASLSVTPIIGPQQTGLALNFTF